MKTQPAIPNIIKPCLFFKSVVSHQNQLCLECMYVVFVINCKNESKLQLYINDILY